MQCDFWGSPNARWGRGVRRGGHWVSVAIVLAFAGCVTRPTEEGGEALPVEIATLGMSIDGSCSADADCRVESDYCAACSCIALAAQDHVDACFGQELTCLVDPCEGQRARCIDGQCATADGALR